MQIRSRDGSIFWESLAGPQVSAVTATEDIVCLTGGRGGGRTTAMLMRPLVSGAINCPVFRGLLVCPDYGCIKNLMEYAGDRYHPLGARILISKKCILFPSGAKIEFLHMGERGAIEYHVRITHHFLGVNDIDGFGDPKKGSWDKDNFFRLLGGLRSEVGEPNAQAFIVATPCERQWVYDFFIHGMEHCVPKVKFGTSRLMVNFSLADNPFLDKGGRYRDMLMQMPEGRQRMWLHGDWPQHRPQ